MTVIFKPNETGEYLEAENGRKIEVREHFYVACNTEIPLTVVNSPRIHCHIFNAVRLESPAVVEGVRVADPAVGHQWKEYQVTEAATELPIGSLLLRTVKPTETGAFKWYGLTLQFEGRNYHNVQRVECVEIEAGLQIVQGSSLAADWGQQSGLLSKLERYKEQAQGVAHLEDAALRERLVERERSRTREWGYF